METTTRRAKLINESILLAWDSLQSHLDWTHKQSSEGQKFHQRCIADYATLIKNLTELY